MTFFKYRICLRTLIHQATGGRKMASSYILKIIFAVLALSFFILLGTIATRLEEKQRYRLHVLQAILFTQFLSFCFAMYVWTNLSLVTGVRGSCMKIFNTALAVFLFLAQSAVISGYILSNVEPHWFVISAYICLGITLLLAFIIFICQMLEYFLNFFYHRRTSMLPVIFKTVCILLVTGVLTMVAIHNAWRLPQIKHFKIPVPNLPRTLRGLKVLQLSDVHIGPTIGRSDVEAIVELSNEQKPDVVVFTGDLVDAPLHIKPAVEALSKLQTKYGAYYIAGNHDFYTGYIDEWITEFKLLNITVLHNQYVSLVSKSASSSQDKIYLSGVFDYEGGLLRSKDFGEELSKALDGREPGVPTILMAHRPSAGKRAITQFKDISLALCGHTHGGKCCPCFCGIVFLNLLCLAYTKLKIVTSTCHLVYIIGECQ